MKVLIAIVVFLVISRGSCFSYDCLLSPASTHAWRDFNIITNQNPALPNDYFIISDIPNTDTLQLNFSLSPGMSVNLSVA